MLNANKNGEFFERPLMTVRLEETGILHVISKNTPRNKSNLEADHVFLLQLVNNKKVCALIDTTNIGLFTTERIEFAKKEMMILYKAVAIVSANEAGKVGGSILSALTPSSIPMKIVSCENEARKWLQQYL